MNDSRIFGILELAEELAGVEAGCDAGVERNESAICDDVKPVGCGR